MIFIIYVVLYECKLFLLTFLDSRPYEYGVVKQVDHNGRTALINWMKTYHAGGDPQ